MTMASIFARRAVSLATRAPMSNLANSTNNNLAFQLTSNLPSGSLPLSKYRDFATSTKSDVPNPVPAAKAGNDDEVPSIFDQATGLERAEIEYPDLFKHNEVLRGPFGTKENPVKIQSHYDQRIVGCTGRPSPDDHDIVWLQVEIGKNIICPICGQYFELDPL